MVLCVSCDEKELLVPRKRAKSSLKTIETGLGSVLGKRQLSALTTMGRLRRLWPEIVGPMLASHSEPSSMERGNLLVDVDHPAMAQQIHFLESKILAACIKRFHIHTVRRIRTQFRNGAGISIPQSPPIKRLKASLGEKKRIARMLRSIQNPELKRALYTARIAQIELGHSET